MPVRHLTSAKDTESAPVGGDVPPSTPVVTVVMPLFNDERYVAEALDSIIAQTFPDFEVIVVDDGSSDGSPEIVAGYAARDARVRLMRQANAGPAAARNAAIAEARGWAIAFLDADDLWLPTKLERQVPLLTENNLVYAAEYTFRDDNPEQNEGPWKTATVAAGKSPLASLIRNPIWGPNTVMVSRSLLQKHGGFDETMPPAEDLELWLRLAAAGTELCQITEPLARYRVRDNSISADLVHHGRASVRAYKKLVADHRNADLRTRLLVRVGLERSRRRLSRRLRSRGAGRISGGAAAAGRADLLESVAIAPLWWRAWIAAVVLGTPGAPRVLAGSRVASQTHLARLKKQ